MECKPACQGDILEAWQPTCANTVTLGRTVHGSCTGSGSTELSDPEIAQAYNTCINFMCIRNKQVVCDLCSKLSKMV